MSRTELTVRYAAFALLAMLLNVGAQWGFAQLYQGQQELLLGMTAGTLVGLVTKYILDKFWIFGDRCLKALENAHRFTLYTLTGAITTAIFWGTELLFVTLNPHEVMRYLGAVTGLSVGYILKFHLDRRLVFQGS